MQFQKIGFYGVCAVGGLFGFVHGLSIRHEYKEADLGRRFAQQVDASTGKLTESFLGQKNPGNTNDRGNLGSA